MTELDGLIGSGRSGERTRRLDLMDDPALLHFFSPSKDHLLFYFTPLLLFLRVQMRVDLETCVIGQSQKGYPVSFFAFEKRSVYSNSTGTNKFLQTGKYFINFWIIIFVKVNFLLFKILSYLSILWPKKKKIIISNIPLAYSVISTLWRKKVPLLRQVYIYIYIYVCLYIHLYLYALLCLPKKKRKKKWPVSEMETPVSPPLCVSLWIERGDAFTSCAHPIQDQPPAFLITTTKFLQVQDKHLKKEFI